MRPDLNPAQARALTRLAEHGGIARTVPFMHTHDVYRSTLQSLERRQLTRSIEHRNRDGSVVHMTRLTDAGREVTA